MTSRLHAAAFITWLAFFAGNPAVFGAGDCSGPVDCPVGPQPFGLAPAQTHVSPPAFDVGPGTHCYNTGGRILAGAITELRSTGSIKKYQETALFTDTPAIEVLVAGTVTPLPVTGTTVHAAGVVCMPHLAQSFMITDQVLAALSGGRLSEWYFPGGVVPLSAAGIGSCLPNNTFDVFTITIELSDNSIMAVAAGSAYVQPIPGPIVATPDSWTNGQFSGSLVFDVNNAYIISGGAMNTIPLIGTYLSHTPVSGGVQVTTTSGTQTISLATGVIVMPYASCSAPMSGCGTPPTIAINVAPCPDISAVAANWPVSSVACRCLGSHSSSGGVPGAGGAAGGGAAAGGGKGGGGGKGKGGKGGGGGPCTPPKIKTKKGTAKAYAFTTLAGSDKDVDKSTLWHGGQPGAPGTPAIAVAFVAAGGDFAYAEAMISASYNPTTCLLEVSKELDHEYALIHKQGHIARMWAAAYDPMTFIDWDASEDLHVAMSLVPGKVLPIRTDLDLSAQSRFRVRATSDIPGYEDLYECLLESSHDGVTPALAIGCVCNPLTGLNATTVEAALAAAVSYDAGAGTYAITSDSDILSFDIDIPVNGTYSLSFTAETQGHLPEQVYFGPPVNWDEDIPPVHDEPAPDYDLDRDVDQDDHALFQMCASGAMVPYEGDCGDRDYDDDGDVDQDDFAEFQRCITLEGVDAGESCLTVRSYLSLVTPSLTQHHDTELGAPPEPTAYAWSIANTDRVPHNWAIVEVAQDGTPYDYPWLLLSPTAVTVPDEGVATIIGEVDPAAPGLETGANVAYVKFTDLDAPDQEHTRAVVLFAEPGPPAVLEALSWMEHGSQGLLALSLLEESDIEPRQGAPLSVEVVFDGEIAALDGIFDAGQEVNLLVNGVPDPSLIDSIIPVGSSLMIELAPGFVPEGSCLEIHLHEIVSATEPGPMLEEFIFTIRTNTGDANRDGIVSLDDQDFIGPAINVPELFQPQFDIVPDGVISLIDMQAIQMNMGHSVVCP